LKIKAEGNDKLKAGDYFSAKCLYSGALEMLDRFCMHLQSADETWESLKNNMALCDFKRQEWTRVVETSTEVLTRNSSNTKALYRRSVAFAAQDRHHDAMRDLRRVLELEPGNVDARRKLSEMGEQRKVMRHQEKYQAGRLRGFLEGERLNNSVPINTNGTVRKLQGNENSPVFASWLKQEYVSASSGVVAAVRAHIVIKTNDGKELFNTRIAPSVQTDSVASAGPAQPARWVLDSSWDCVFGAWNDAVKALQLGELGRFEIAHSALAPTVEDAIQHCIAKWLAPRIDEHGTGLLEAAEARDLCRKHALQILGLPEKLCFEPPANLDDTLSMEMELLEVCEFQKLGRDHNCRLLRVSQPSQLDLSGARMVTDLSVVSAHYRISKLLQDHSLKDSRLGLVSTADGIVMRRSSSKPPVEFVVGEEDACCEDADFVPPCVGECLIMHPGDAIEGMQFELILPDGVPLSQMDKSMAAAHHEGMLASIPDTTGPAFICIEIEKVSLPSADPARDSWRGAESLRQERQRAEELQNLIGGAHKAKALKRWRRIIMWLVQIMRGRRWRIRIPKGAVQGNMYSLEWDAEGGSGAELHGTTEADLSLVNLEDALVGQLEADELVDWATAHAAVAEILGQEQPGDSEAHARRVVQASVFGQVPQGVEIRGRSSLAARLSERGSTAEALQVLQVAMSLDPTNRVLRDQTAVATQREEERQSQDIKGMLRRLKENLGRDLNASDLTGLRASLKELEGLPLTWEAVQETAIGKEIGRCAKLEDAQIASQARALVGSFHRLAKQERPLWVR